MRTFLTVLVALLGLHLLCACVKIGRCETVQQSEDDDFPSEQDYPLLLHEHDVMHYATKYGEFEMVGDGAFADVTLGQLRDSGTQVVIKSFRDSSFSRILREVRVHRLLEPLGISPRLFGLLPFGAGTGNISVVYEYISDALPLFYYLEEGRRLTYAQWLDVCRQITQHLQLLHVNDVLFNDLHSLNVMLKSELTGIKVYFIDFGSATHRKGRDFNMTYQSLQNYKFMAPELINNSLTTVKSDVFSLGFIFSEIQRRLRDLKLSYLAQWCNDIDPDNRPSTEEVILKLNAFIFESCLRNCRQQNLVECERYSNLRTPGKTSSSDTIGFGHVDQKSVESEGIQNYEVKDIFELPSQPNKKPFPILDEEDFDWDGFDSNSSRLSDKSGESIYIAKLKRTQKTVVIKEYKDVGFGYVRDEIGMTSYLASKGVAPNVIGMTLLRKHLRSAGMVQEMFGKGVTLLQYVLRSRKGEWDKGFLEMAMRSNHPNENYEYDAIVSHIMDTSGLPFTSYLNEWVWKICRAKSYRQHLFENIASMMVSHMNIVHLSGHLLNNFNLRNILIWGGEYKRKCIHGSCSVGGDENKLSSTKKDQDSFRLEDVQVKLIDLNNVCDMEGTFLCDSSDDVSLFPYIAPEVGLCHTTSVQSDIYSLCWALQWLMAEYVSASYAWSKTGDGHNQTQQSQRKETFLECQHTQKSHCPNTSDEQATSPSPWWDQHFGGTPSAYSHFNELIHHCLHSPRTQRPHIADIKEAVQRLKDA